MVSTQSAVLEINPRRKVRDERGCGMLSEGGEKTRVAVGTAR